MNNDMADAADSELRIARLINAPRELVFEIWTDPEHVKHWWGPNGFTNTINVMDVRPGGDWDLVMHGPDGTDYKNKSVFVEVIKPERIIYDHISGPKFRATVLFEEQGNKTLITMSMRFESSAIKEKTIKEFSADKGQVEHFNRMEEYLRKIG